MPTMLPGGSIMILDNGTERKWTRVLEIDPPTGETVWEYRLPDHAYASALSGQELLPNGNILICSGTGGGMFLEVTREKEIVWEFHNRIEGHSPGDPLNVYRCAFCPADTVEYFLGRSKS
jgi:hypothetical protein